MRSAQMIFNFIKMLQQGFIFYFAMLFQNIHPTALGLKCRYVGFIRSRKKRDAVFANLLNMGFSQAQLDEIHAPTGTDINAITRKK